MVEIYFDDLKTEAQEAILEELGGDIGNYDLWPLFYFGVDDDEEDEDED